MKKYYAFDLYGKRIPNVDGQQVDGLFAAHRIAWITRDSSVRIATDDNLAALVKERCGFCGSTKKLSCTRGMWRKEKGDITPDQFETVCSKCLQKYKGRTPKSQKRFVQHQRHLATDFELRYPGSMMVALTDDRSRDTGIAGYVTPAEALSMSEDGFGRIQVLGGKNCVAFSFYGKGHRRSSVRRELREELLEEADNVCLFCRKQFPDEDLTIDHKRSLRLMGTNDKENLVVACDECNQEKGTMGVQEFIDYLRRRGEAGDSKRKEEK